MSTYPNDSCFLFVIKTDSYAGNFEREMCGYMTGQIGECGVGDDGAAMFTKDCPGNCGFQDLVTEFPDEHGCRRPATGWGHEFSSVAIFFESQPTAAQLTFLRQRARQFAAMTDPYYGGKKFITILGFELRDYVVKHIDTGIASWGEND